MSEDIDPIGTMRPTIVAAVEEDGLYYHQVVLHPDVQAQLDRIEAMLERLMASLPPPPKDPA